MSDVEAAGGTGVRCRAIADSDLDATIAFLCAGFPGRSDDYWRKGLARHAAQPLPPDVPRFGVLLERAGGICGILLTLYRVEPDGALRCNLSSWCLLPEARLYASLLDAAATRRTDCTYINVSPAPSTWPLLDRRGYRRFCEGQLIAAPALQPTRAGARARFVGAGDALDDLLVPERQLVRDHLGYGCVACVATDGAGSAPLVFRRRTIGLVPNRKHWGALPCLQLIYSRDGDDLARFAGPVGRVLLRRTGIPFIVCDAVGPTPGLGGRYFPGRAIKVARGPAPPRLGDLAYTELVIFGP